MKLSGKNKIKFKNNRHGFDSYDFKLGDMLRGERATLGKSLMDVQRELRINVDIISAIEDCDIVKYRDSVFISGYVRSYAKFLNLDPQLILELFCIESGYKLPSLNDREKISLSFNKKNSSQKKYSKKGYKDNKSIFLEKPSIFHNFKLRSFFSMTIVTLMICGLSSGGWLVIKEIQQINIIDEDIIPIIIDEGFEGLEEDSDLLNIQMLKRKQIVFTSIDGPIVDINTRQSGIFPLEGGELTNSLSLDARIDNKTTQNWEGAISIMASRPAWVRIYTKSGEIIDEEILDTSQIMSVPSNIKDIILRSGNAGSVFIKVGDVVYGPIGEGTAVVKDISLNYKDILENFNVVNDDKLLNPLKRINVITKNNN